MRYRHRLLLQSGLALERCVYSPYGALTVCDSWYNTQGASGYAHVYTHAGRYLDAETGMYYYRHRMYHAQMGRFGSRDPAGYEGGDSSLYAYVQNNPAIHTDPKGKWRLPIIITGPANPIISICNCRHQRFAQDNGYRPAQGQEGICQNLVKKYSSGYTCSLGVCTSLGTAEGMTYRDPICARMGCVSSSLASNCGAGNCAGFMHLVLVTAHECYHWKSSYFAPFHGEENADAQGILVLMALKNQCAQLAQEPNSPCPSVQQCETAIDVEVEGVQSGEL